MCKLTGIHKVWHSSERRNINTDVSLASCAELMGRGEGRAAVTPQKRKTGRRSPRGPHLDLGLAPRAKRGLVDGQQDHLVVGREHHAVQPRVKRAHILAATDQGRVRLDHPG